MINPLYGVLGILVVLLILSLYNLFEKDQEIQMIRKNISELQSKVDYMKSENERLVDQLRDISNSILQRETLISQLRREIDSQRELIVLLNSSLQSERNRSKYLEDQYIELRARMNNITGIAEIVREIEYRLRWVELNMEGSSDEYRELLNEVANNCLLNTSLDISCVYILAEMRMNVSPNDADDIFLALRKRSGDCLTFSLLMFRIIRDLKPISLIYLDRSSGSVHSVRINNTVYNIRNLRGVSEILNNYRIACIGLNQKGHCGLLINERIFVDYMYGIRLGRVDENIRKCESKRCEWREGYITMQITHDDIFYLNTSLRELVSQIRG